MPMSVSFSDSWFFFLDPEKNFWLQFFNKKTADENLFHSWHQTFFNRTMPAITGIEYKVSQFCTQSEVFSESCQSKPNLNCNYIFPIDWAPYRILFGAQSVVSQLRICRPPPSPLRSGHLDIKDAQWPENKDGRKVSYHIINIRALIPVEITGGASRWQLLHYNIV